MLYRKKDTVGVINKKLTMTKRDVLIDIFWAFPILETTQFSIVLIHLVLYHLINRGDVKKELWFRINGVDVYFNPLEFVMVIGLILGHDTNVLRYVDYFRHFLVLETTQFSVILIHLVLFYLINGGDVEKELWFRINGVNVCFSALKFVVVTGLMLGHDTKVLGYMDCLGYPYLK